MSGGFKTSSPRLLIGGIALALAAGLYFWRYGHGPLFLPLWTASMLLALAFFYPRRALAAPSGPWDAADLGAALALGLSFLPLYVGLTDLIPFRVNPDEIVELTVEMAEVRRRPARLLGLTDYFHFPATVYWLRGWIGHWMGGVDLANMRMLSGLSGLCSIVAFYFLLRAGQPRIYALGGAVLLGASHVFMGLSRMAFYTNTSLLSEVAALGLLSLSVQRGCLFLGFLGGSAAGFTFHTYQTSRITILVWCLFVLARRLWTCKQPDRQIPIRLLAVHLFGFFLVASPVLLATLKDYPQSLAHARRSVMLFREGKETAQAWTGGISVPLAVRENIRRAVTAFNNRLPDHGWQYPNAGTGHGFLDPVSGALLWLGLLSTLYRVARRRASDHDLLMACGFLFIWFVLIFAVNKAPDYSRFLIVLPFVFGLVSEALQSLARGLQRLVRIRWAGRRLGGVCYRMAVVAIALLNVSIFERVMTKEWREGHVVGSTVRYVERRRQIPGYAYYQVANGRYPYFGWGDKGTSWVQFFLGPQQNVALLPPEKCLWEPLRRPFTAFMSRRYWLEKRAIWLARYPDLEPRSVLADASLLAIEAL